MKIGLYARLLKTAETVQFLQNLLNLLKERGIEYYFYHKFEDHLKHQHGLLQLGDVFHSSDLNENPLDAIISIGGDGTMLDTLQIVRDTEVPVLGVNIGRFGFLASTQMQSIEDTLDEFQNNSYGIEKRTVLQLDSEDQNFITFPFALNDFVIQKKDSSSMITVHTYLNGEFLNSYWSDGLIVATPTGSSGYSLSCGGPLLFPGSASFVVTPIAPHNLNVRPIAISDNNIVTMEVAGRTRSVMVSMDSRSESVDINAQLAIKKAPFTFNLIKLSNENYMKTLRNKLNWGSDIRN
jgi:NAD+ kinase